MSNKRCRRCCTKPNAWGEEVTQSVADPDTSALTTTYDYYADPALPGHYRKIKSVVQPTGNWESYVYYDWLEEFGSLNYIFRPWHDGPTTPYTTRPDTPTIMTPGVYRAYLANDPDWTGQRTIPIFKQEWIDGIGSGLTYGTSNDWGYHDALSYRTVDRTLWAQDGKSVTRAIGRGHVSTLDKT